VWDTETGAAVGQPLTGHTATVWAMTALRTAGGRELIASAGDDGTVRCWDAHRIAAAGEPMTGHAGWIPALAACPVPGGPARLLSGGADGTIRLWDPESGRSPQVLHVARAGLNWVLALTAWPTDDGRVRIAFGGDASEIQVYDADSGTAVTGPLAGHTGWIRALATWIGRDNRRILASGSVDGSIRLWDAETGQPTGAPMHGHAGAVRSLVPWTDPQGNPRLASAGSDDATIRLWDPETGSPIGAPLTGHKRGVWDLAGWRTAGGSVRLASTGYDGTIRLWDLNRQRAMRVIEVGPVAIWALSDAPATVDLLDRQRWADAIADQLIRPAAPADPVDPVDGGPTVVSVEGPWGSGKTTLMQLVRRRLDERHPPAPPPQVRRRSATMKRYTVRAALREIVRHGRHPSRRPSPPPRPPSPRPPDAGAGALHRSVLTVWFNPWVHQSGEQAWAGLAHEIIERAGTVLYPTEGERERYWFRRNLGRSDRYSLRRALYRRVVSPMLGVALGAIVAPLAIALAELNVPFQLLGRSVTAATIALVVSAACLVAGIAHTTVRYLFSPAAHYLPAALFHGPVTDTDLLSQGGLQVEIVADPLRRARVGALYLYQHDIGEVITDLRDTGCDLVVFVDDIDRCRTAVTAEVFEAINLFLSGVNADTGLRCRFVIGLDPEVIAAHLDGHYPDHYHHRTARRGDDPSAGWAFLRKLVQLPIVLPQAGDDSIPRFIDRATSAARPSHDGETAEPDAAAGTAPVAAGGGTSVAGPSPGKVADSIRENVGRPPTEAAATPVDTLAWRSLEQHPDVRSWLTARLRAQPGRSVRDAKRLINVWQFYARVSPDPGRSSDGRSSDGRSSDGRSSDGRSPDAPDGRAPDVRASIARAKHLLIFAEIVTRWPALLRSLQWRSDGRAGLDRLAASTTDENRWNQAVAELGIEMPRYEHQLRDLRRLLLQCDPRIIGNLADTLL
jgi:WD40 repeat protein